MLHKIPQCWCSLIVCYSSFSASLHHENFYDWGPKHVCEMQCVVSCSLPRTVVLYTDNHTGNIGSDCGYTNCHFNVTLFSLSCFASRWECLSCSIQHKVIEKTRCSLCRRWGPFCCKACAMKDMAMILKNKNTSFLLDTNLRKVNNLKMGVVVKYPVDVNASKTDWSHKNPWNEHDFLPPHYTVVARNVLILCVVSTTFKVMFFNWKNISCQHHFFVLHQ